MAQSFYTYAYSRVEKQVLARFYGNLFGPYEEEIVLKSGGALELSALVFPPIESQPFYKVATFGMGAYPMPVPEKLQGEGLEHAEIMIYLPKNWPDMTSDHSNAWPIRSLLGIGQSLVQAQTCLGYGTLIPNGNHRAFAPNTELNSFALVRSLARDGGHLEARLPNGNRLNFYQAFPLYPEEYDHLLVAGHSLGDLLAQFKPQDLSAIINLQRPNYGK